jgi:hypothetical protein
VEAGHDDLARLLPAEPAVGGHAGGAGRGPARRPS